MRLSSLKKKLANPEKIGSRVSTIESQFARAIASYDQYQEEVVREAMLLLGQDPDGDLCCVYCLNPATNWDHLNAVTRDHEYSGFGYRIRNFVPSCSSCDSIKGNRAWRSFVANNFPDTANELTKLLEKYSQGIEEEAKEVSSFEDRCSGEMVEYREIRGQIVELMKKADGIAGRIRVKVYR